MRLEFEKFYFILNVPFIIRDYARTQTIYESLFILFFVEFVGYENFKAKYFYYFNAIFSIFPFSLLVKFSEVDY